MAIVAVTISNSYLKYIIADINVPNFMFLKFSISFVLLIFYMSVRKKFVNMNMREVKAVFPFSLLSMVVFL